jgi:hypothetical protein
VPRKLTSTVLYLRTFRGTKSDNDMVAGITEALCGLAKLIIIGSAGAEVSLRRYWSRRYGEGVDHSDRLDYVVSTDDSWRQEVHRQISRANCILFYLAPKRGRFPSPNPSMMSLDKFFSSPLFKGSSGEGLLQEIVYLRRLNKLPQTVLICRREDLENISRTISLAMIDAHSEPAPESYWFINTPSGIQAATPRFSTFGKQMVSLRRVHGIVTFDPINLTRSAAKSEFGPGLRVAVRHVIWKDRWRRINPRVRRPQYDDVLGKSSAPRSLPPDDAQKIIQFTNVEDLLYIPRAELTDISPAEIVKILSPRDIKSGCLACSAPFHRLFFFVRSLHRKDDEVIRVRCQNCLRQGAVEDGALGWA